MRIHILRCGSESLPAAFGEKRKRVPNCAYLIEHPKGLVLVDTGWAREHFPDGTPSAAARAALTPRVLRYYDPLLPPGEAAVEQLKAMGIAPRDLELVVMTTLNADHVSALSSLSAARRLLVCETEFFWSCRSVFKRFQPRGLWNDLPLEVYYMRGSPVGPTGHSYDVFGDGSLLMVETEGCTTGQASVMVHSGGKYALISSDLAPTAAAVAELKISKNVFYPIPAKRSVEWLKRSSESPNCAANLINHDPSQSGIVDF